MCDGLLRAAERADPHLQCCYLPSSALATPQMRRLGDYTLACSDTAGKIAGRTRPPAGWSSPISGKPHPERAPRG
jgi:hypothetical protein